MDVNVLIYVLEDQQIVVDLIKKGFDNAGINNYHFFTDAIEMLNKIDSNVHIAVLDYHLNNTDVSGLEVMKAILKKNPYCYIIAISATVDLDVPIAFLNDGARGYVRKQGQYIGELVMHVIKAIEFVKGNINYYHSLLTKENELKKYLNK